MSNLNDYLLRYVESRGIEMPFYDSGSKITEEAQELRDAVRARDRDAVMDESADVTITALVAARQFDFTLEEALEKKIAKDTGRGEKRA